MECDCPFCVCICGGPAILLGRTGIRIHLRCRDCGMECTPAMPNESTMRNMNTRTLESFLVLLRNGATHALPALRASYRKAVKQAETILAGRRCGTRSKRPWSKI